jgi:hypothetical protein
MNLQEEKNRVGGLLGETPNDFKVIRKKDGLIERVRAESHKIVLTEDNKNLLLD